MCNNSERCTFKTQHDEAQYQGQRLSAVAAMAVGAQAMAILATMPTWNQEAFTSINCDSYGEIKVQVRSEQFGREIADLLLPAGACFTHHTLSDGFRSLRWAGMYGGYPLSVVAAWSGAPDVERDLDAETLARGVAEGWAEPETDPTQLDWESRQSQAFIPFEVIEGRPVTPGPRTGVQRGRNQMGCWGENLMADALVTATTGDGGRWVLLVERGDGYGWAIPGGKVETGETPARAAGRELEEETGLGLQSRAWTCDAPRVVPDPRASDEAWAVTVVARAHLASPERLPQVAGADDATRAAWVRAASYAELTANLRDRFTGTVFAAHVDLLAQLASEKNW